MRAVIVALGLSAFLAPVTALANPVGIQVLSATYTADISLNDPVAGSTVTRTATGSDPVSASLTWQNSSAQSIYGSASADWLAVSVQLDNLESSGFGGSSSANLDLTFSPLNDSIATLGIDYINSPEYGSGLGVLFDLTTQQEVWRLYWGAPYTCDICPVNVIYPGGVVEQPLPGEPACRIFVNGAYQDAPCGPFEMPTVLNDADVYDLHLYANAFDPAGLGHLQPSFLQVSGLVPVPEPSSLLLLGTGLTTLSTFRRRFRR